ncbi:hypothetical protein KAI87_08470, partial [Myxococcota bacterium]|nr:hypothetical protein [Myxococcota bacterium]
KGYAVGGDAKTQAAAAQGPAVAPGGVPTRHYFLVTEKAAPGMSQYDVDLFINSKWVKKFLDSEGHVVMDITKHLVTGPNKIVFIAKKNMGSGRRSSSPNHYFRIVMGEGNAGGRNIMISKKLIDYKRTALETRAFQDKYELIAH